MNKILIVLCVVSMAALSAGCSRDSSHSQGATLGQPLTKAAAAKLEELGPDGAFTLSPEAFSTYASAAGADTLDTVVKVGARALAWVDLMQKDLRPQDREQIWRRIDRIGHEPSPENPLVYNPEIILGKYHDALAAMPKAVLDVITGDDALPSVPPAGLTIKDVVAPIRELNTVYSRASRWLALYQYHDELPRVGMDMRGWLKVRQDRDELLALTQRWDTLSSDDRARFIAEVSESCTLTTSELPADCAAAKSGLNAPGKRADAADWLLTMVAKGQASYDYRFVVQQTHENVAAHNDGMFHEVDIPAIGIDKDTMYWIQDRINEAWWFKRTDDPVTFVFGVKLRTADAGTKGGLKVEWQNGALPHVNGIAGDTITMDANEPRWLEQVQVTMRHEFGHVLGFPDCYVEFWDDQKQAFIDYALDPDNAMCALSGGYHDVHRDALLKAYYPVAQP